MEGAEYSLGSRATGITHLFMDEVRSAGKCRIYRKFVGIKFRCPVMNLYSGESMHIPEMFQLINIPILLSREEKKCPSIQHSGYSSIFHTTKKRNS